MAKRRTPAQIRASATAEREARREARESIRSFKKMMAARKRSLKGNPKRKNATKKKKPSAKARKMKRADKGLSAWVRSGMPANRNRPRKKKAQCNPRRKKQATVTVAQARRLYELGRRAPKTPVALVRNPKGVRIVTGKAAKRVK